jgi:predicted RNase H-like HicB family nuclease
MDLPSKGLLIGFVVLSKEGLPMSVKSRIKECVGGSNFSDEMSFTVALREDKEEGGFVAECLDMPGCVSEGETEEEAVKNIKKAIHACLDVIFEDSVREVMRNRHLSASYVGISDQRRITIKPKDWELQAV